VNVPPSSNGKKPEVPDGGSQSSEESDSFPDLPKLPDNPTLNLIASGAMGDIYKVKVAPGQDYEHCVLKRFQLKYQDSAWIELDNNCAIGSRLGHHPNIAKFLGPLMDEDVGELLLAFEYIHGSDVGAMFDKCRPILPADDLLRLAQHVIRGSVSALAALENIDHAHNDIKPNNILFDENSKEAKLVDFGNAHLHGYHRPLGNPSYCPPERLGTVNAMLFPSQGGASSKNASQTPYLKMNSRDLRKIEEFERNANLSPDHLYVTPRGRKEFRPDHLKLEDEKKKKVAITNKTDAFSIGQVLYRLVEGREYYAFENLPKAEDLPPSQAAAIEKIRPQADNFVANLANTGGGTANNLTLLYLLGQSADVFKDRGQVFTKAEQTDPAKIAVQYYDFVNMAMAPDESKRYSCVQLLDHPFLANPPSKEEVEGILAKRYPLPKEFTL
jgi:serine/threonine protein kinase